MIQKLLLVTIALIGININSYSQTAMPAIVDNDECITAMEMVAGQNDDFGKVSAVGTLNGATASAEINECAGSADDDVWFRFVAQSTTNYLHIGIPAQSNVTFNHAVYSGSCGSLTLLTCGLLSSNASTFVVGETYYIRVWSTLAAAQTINFTFSVVPPLPPMAVSTNQFTVPQLVTDVFANTTCLNISNISSSTGTNFGSLNGIGSFTNTNPTFPMSSGIVLVNGAAANVPGPNTSVLGTNPSNWNSNDVDLNNIAPSSGSLSNLTKLEFDFSSPLETINFNFVYAAEEYGQYQCAFTDYFVFILTDLVTGTKTNLGVVPGTNIPVTTTNVRDGAYSPSCQSVNPQYFDRYFTGNDNYAAATNFNGHTVLMTASSPITPNHPYHLKLAIADYGDATFDSAIFLQAGSFAAGVPECGDSIQLFAFVDANANGVKDNGEMPFNYGSFNYQQNNAGEITAIVSPSGFFNFYDSNPANTYDFNYAIDSEYASYYALSAVNFNDLNIPVGSGTQTLYFPITLTQGYNDVSVTIIPLGQPVAGFEYTNKIIYRNQGVTATSGTINFTKDPVLNIVSIGQPGTVTTPEGFSYDFTDLQPNESRSFNVVLNVPPIPTVALGDMVTNTATITAPANDFDLDNNSFENTQIIVGSYDPNDKMEAHGEKINFNEFAQDDYLTYTIRFQNTGTANAINIYIEDILDAQFDASSIRMISASHSYVMERVANKVFWKFNNIQLPSELLNEALSHGYITFKIKLHPGFEIGDLVPNYAFIFFDFNPAIVTNTFTTEFVIPLSTPEFSQENIALYPNPANTMVQVTIQNTEETIESIVLFDMLGKEIKKVNAISAQHTAIDVSGIAKGIYLVEISTKNNFRQVKKLVIE